MDTSRAPLPAPKRKSATTSAPRLGAMIGSGSATKKTSAVARTTVRLPSRAVARPDSGIPTSAPAAIARRARPSTLGPSASFAATMGMCGTQLAKPAPFAKKMPATARRARVGDGITTSDARDAGWCPGSSSGAPIASRPTR
jgi:hypothetical protein